jgi:hypothetical protein
MGLLGLDDVLPPRPRGMHHCTYQRLERLDEQLAERWRVGMSGFLEVPARPAQSATR